MRVVVTGGTGFIGRTLARQLLERGTLVGPSGGQEPIERIVLLDTVLPDALPAWLDDPRIEVVEGEVTDEALVRDLVAGPAVSVFHLASVVSGGAEQDFDLALRVNLDGGRVVLEACRAAPGRPRLVLASTFAAFGGELPRRVSDRTKLTPETTYGTTKVILELLVNDYTRKGFLDGRSARYPTVIVRPGKPNLAASSWVSAVVREPLAGRDFALPVPLETPTLAIGVRAAAAGTIHLHDLPGEALGHDRAVTFPGIEVTAGQLLDAARRAGATGTVTVERDPFVERICAGWPTAMEPDRADALGLPRDASVDAIVRDYVADEA